MRSFVTSALLNLTAKSIRARKHDWASASGLVSVGHVSVEVVHRSVAGVVSSSLKRYRCEFDVSIRNLQKLFPARRSELVKVSKSVSVSYLSPICNELVRFRMHLGRMLFPSKALELSSMFVSEGRHSQQM